MGAGREIKLLIALCLIIGSSVPAFGEQAPGNAPEHPDSPRLSALTLADCLDLALRKNFDIQQAKERMESQRGVVLEARGRFFPELGMSAQLLQRDPNRVQSFNGEKFGSDTSWVADIGFQHALYTGGRDTALLERERLTARASAYELAAVVNAVLAGVKERFYGVLLAKAQISVQQENVKLLEEELRYEQNKLDAGTVSDFNVLRAEVELANSRTPLIRAENALPLAVEELRRAIGLELEGSAPATAIIGVEGELSYQPLEITLEQALAKAERHRPELSQLALQLEAAAKLRRAATAEYLPSVSWNASYGADKSQFSNSLDDQVHGWRAGAAVDWNLFNGFQTEGRVTQAESAASQARISRAKERLDIEVEVRRAFSSLTEAQALVQASIKVVAQAEESLRLARARADAGSATQLDVLDTQVALTQARTNKVQALYDYNFALAEMEQALGLLAQVAEANP